MEEEIPEVAISGPDASVKLRPRERGLDDSVRLSVRAAGYGFGGRNRSVWVSHAELRRFLQALAKVDATPRRGHCRVHEPG